MKCRYCGHELGDPELCPEGEQLWCNYVGSGYHFPEYEDYCKHIVDCEECQRRLGLSEAEIEILREELEEEV